MNAKSLYHYLIIGAGRQGTAAAYDLAVFGKARTVKLAVSPQRILDELAIRKIQYHIL